MIKNAFVWFSCVALAVIGVRQLAAFPAPPCVLPGRCAVVSGPRISFVQVAADLTAPTDVGAPADGSERLFVVEQAGLVRIIQGGTLLPTPFLDITNRVLSGGERGLLGIAFPPDYAAKRYFYVDYTAASAPEGHTVVARYHVTANPNLADAGSEEVILAVDQPFSNHNGGQLAFGPDDGYLYISLGDGGSGGDPLKNAQNLGTLLGKILRIDVESGTSPYAIPPGNPFVGIPGARGEIWAYGLRNPWRFSFDRETADLYISDVGQSLYEEIDFQEAGSAGGANYGWNILEGNHCYAAPTCTPPDNYVPPVFEYDHADDNCSITGGFVYRGKQFPGMQGIYFYGDFCSGRIGGLWRQASGWHNELLADTAYLIATFGEDEAGNLYVADRSAGILYKIVADDAVPVPDIRINDQHGPLAIAPHSPVAITISLEPGNAVGMQADWWAAAATPSGVLWYNGRSWTTRQSVGFQGALFPLSTVELARVAGLLPGSYTVYFGVDLVMDGRVNQPLYYDSAVVNVH